MVGVFKTLKNCKTHCTSDLEKIAKRLGCRTGETIALELLTICTWTGLRLLLDFKFCLYYGRQKKVWGPGCKLQNLIFILSYFLCCKAVKPYNKEPEYIFQSDSFEYFLGQLIAPELK